jgi:hypothetical protein
MTARAEGRIGRRLVTRQRKMEIAAIGWILIFGLMIAFAIGHALAG